MVELKGLIKVLTLRFYIMSNRHDLNVGLARMLCGGVIMDVTSPEQALVAEDAGAVAVMALERVPADIRAQGGVARMADPLLIKEIKKIVSIPVMAKVRIGHFVEAKVLEALHVDYIDESEVLEPADQQHIIKRDFSIPFVCGVKDLAEAMRRVAEGVSLLRTKGEAGSGNIIEAVKHLRSLNDSIRALQKMTDEDLKKKAQEYRVSLNLVRYVVRNGKLPVPNFAAGGIVTPADAALVMHLGAEAVFVGSGIFKSDHPKRRATAIVGAVAHWKDYKRIAELSEGLGEAMIGISAQKSLKMRLLQDSEVSS